MTRYISVKSLQKCVDTREEEKTFGKVVATDVFDSEKRILLPIKLYFNSKKVCKMFLWISFIKHGGVAIWYFCSHGDKLFVRDDVNNIFWNIAFIFITILLLINVLDVFSNRTNNYNIVIVY